MQTDCSIKKHYAFRLNPAVIERLDYFREQHTDLSTRTEIVEEALAVYLAYLDDLLPIFHIIDKTAEQN
ncbi:MAG: hypothetical protein EBQ96_07535 [Proteobacteria bacterium]|nr:hypothetical protein [Pseudomonadota bacterium]